MYDKYQRVVFKDDFKSSNDILHRLNKKAEIVLNNWISCFLNNLKKN